MSEQTALVKKDSFTALTKDRERVKKVIAANLGNVPDASAFSLPRIKTPSGGTQSWNIPTAQGEDNAKHLDCIILAHQPCRGYWPGEFKGGEPPQCSSPDGVTGFGDPGGSCRSCPYAQWESAASGRGQACKAMWRLFILREGAILPYLLTLSPTSLKPFQTYMTTLAFTATPYYLAITRIGLDKAKNADGIDYSVATFQQVGELGEEDEARIEEYAQLIEPYLTAPVGAEEYAGEDGGIET
jgi:hypothetical protein